MGEIFQRQHGKSLGVVTKVENARFKQLVRPGDQLEIEVQLKEQLAQAFYFSGKIKVAGKVVAQLDFTCEQVEQTWIA